MRVTTYKTIDVECEVDVEFEDVCSMLVDVASEGKDYPSRLTAALDTLTKILRRIEPEWIARMKPEHRAELHRRLAVEAARYATTDHHEQAESGGGE